jgi:opacity protein-like surface antigen
MLQQSNGPVDLFVNVGAINSSISLKLKDSVVGQPTQHFSADESNGMMAYGGGAAYNFGRWALRAEYEAYDVSKLDNLYLISGSVMYRFGGD